MAALAVLLIVGGALASGWLALRSGQRADYLMVVTDVSQGQQIADTDLDVVSLPDDLADTYVLASRQDDVVGQEATTPLKPGMVLTDDFFAEDVGTEEGKVVQAFQVSEGEISSAMGDGSHVLVILTSTDPDAIEPTAVPGEVIRIKWPEEGEGGIGGGAGSAVASVTVSFEASCSTQVGQASADEAFIIQLFDPEAKDQVALNPCTKGSETDTPTEDGE